MCKHHFVYPEDRPENYNPDGQTLIGRCKCGVTQQAYGMHWAIPVCEEFLDRNKRMEITGIVDNLSIKW
ncbi:MAG: hypothetical protein V1709_06420 [Planctomycetota bacterium]